MSWTATASHLCSLHGSQLFWASFAAAIAHPYLVIVLVCRAGPDTEEQQACCKRCSCSSSTQHHDQGCRDYRCTQITALDCIQSNVNASYNMLKMLQRPIACSAGTVTQFCECHAWPDVISASITLETLEASRGTQRPQPLHLSCQHIKIAVLCKHRSRRTCRAGGLSNRESKGSHHGQRKEHSSLGLGQSIGHSASPASTALAVHECVHTASLNLFQRLRFRH